MLIGIWTPMLVVFLVIIFVGIVALAVYLALRHIRASNVAVKSTTQLSDERAARLKALASARGNPDFAQRIERVSDDVRFSDSSIVLPLDTRISELIDSLYAAIQANDKEGAVDDLTELSSLAAQRRAESSRVKRGSF